MQLTKEHFDAALKDLVPQHEPESIRKAVEQILFLVTKQYDTLNDISARLLYVEDTLDSHTIELDTLLKQHLRQAFSQGTAEGSQQQPAV